MILVWALNFIVGKFALQDFEPVLLGCLRMSIAGLLMIPIYSWNAWHPKATREPAWTRRDFLPLALLGILGVALNQLFFILGLNHTSVGHSAIFIGLTPILVLCFAALRRLEAFTARKLLGMLIALGGIAVLNLGPSKSSGATLLGDFLTLLAGATFAMFTVFGKEATRRHGGITVNTFAYLGSAVLLLPVTAWRALGFDFGAVTLSGWLALIYMAVFPSVLAYLIYYYALTYIPASRVSAFTYAQPPIATLLAVPLLGESITHSLVFGGTLVLAGVYVTERSAGSEVAAAAAHAQAIPVGSEEQA